MCLAVNPVGKPDAGNRLVRFHEQGWETGALAIGPKLPRPSSTLPKATFGRLGPWLGADVSARRHQNYCGDEDRNRNDRLFQPVTPIDEESRNKDR